MQTAAPAMATPTAGTNRAAELLRRHSDGDREAFAELVAEHQAAAHACAWRVTGDGALADDVVQEAFLRVLDHHEDYDAERPFRTWLLHITRNLAIDALRRRRHLHPEERIGERSAPAAPAELEARELRERVALALTDLPDKYRDILIQREMEGVAAEDIAAAIGVDYGTTRWRLHQARSLFRQAWLRRFGGEP